ncbi:fimbrial protein [Yersinia sp. 2545 StPb PI]|uniref:fimbrial protein n=1 Tax=unclassified Yersinia (in: enterobacteria) TaxID=2653513 RepID=UPI003FA4CC4F
MSSGGSPIFNTNIPGLGVQLGAVTSAGNLTGWIGTGNNIDGNINQVAFISSPSVMPSLYAGAAVAFYKTGPMTSGVLTQRVGSMILGATGSWATEVPINISGMTVTVLSCSLTTPTFTVPLGNIYATSFTGVGSFTGAQSFNLGLNCASGSKINVSMAGTQDANTVNTSVLALTGAGTAGVAKGVGAQILYNNSPLTIGSWLLLKTSAGGVETFPFTARYYQTLSNVLPGTANATATLNITYQ